MLSGSGVVFKLVFIIIDWHGPDFFYTGISKNAAGSP